MAAANVRSVAKDIFSWAFVHTGQYDSQGTLNADIASYALEG